MIPQADYDLDPTAENLTIRMRDSVLVSGFADLLTLKTSVAARLAAGLASSVLWPFITLDLTRVETLNSYGISLIAFVAQEAESHHRRLRVLCPAGPVHRAALFCRINHITDLQRVSTTAPRQLHHERSAACE